MDDTREKYRDHLYQLDRSSQESFDKAILSLSGGGLGISFAFADRLLGDPPYHAPMLLVLAWASWAISIVVCLWSHFSSGCALRKALATLDDQETGGSADSPANNADRTTAAFNVAAGVFFPVGVLFLALFVLQNVGGPR